MLVSKREVVFGLSAISLAGCARPGDIQVDPKTVDIIQLITNGARIACGFLPTAHSIAQMIAALAIPAGVPIEAAANEVAAEFCKQIPPVVKAAQAGVRQSVRRVERTTGKAYVDYGVVLVKGKPVAIEVYE